MNVIATLLTSSLPPKQKAAVKLKVSHAAVKSFDRHGVRCKNVQTVQFSRVISF